MGSSALTGGRVISSLLSLIAQIADVRDDLTEVGPTFTFVIERYVTSSHLPGPVMMDVTGTGEYPAQPAAS